MTLYLITSGSWTSELPSLPARKCCTPSNTVLTVKLREHSCRLAQSFSGKARSFMPVNLFSTFSCWCGHLSLSCVPSTLLFRNCRPPLHGGVVSHLPHLMGGHMTCPSLARKFPLPEHSEPSTGKQVDFSSNNINQREKEHCVISLPRIMSTLWVKICSWPTFPWGGESQGWRTPRHSRRRAEGPAGF